MEEGSSFGTWFSLGSISSATSKIPIEKDRFMIIEISQNLDSTESRKDSLIM